MILTKEDIINTLDELWYYEEDFPTNSIFHQDISHIISRWDFYIEELTAAAWDWESYLYLDYYDNSLNKIILVDEIKTIPEFKSRDELVSYVLELQDLYLNTSKTIFNLVNNNNNA